MGFRLNALKSSALNTAMSHNKITLQEAIDKIQIESKHFAKRQITWFKRDPKIHWIKTQKQAEKLIKNFL